MTCRSRRYPDLPIRLASRRSDTLPGPCASPVIDASDVGGVGVVPRSDCRRLNPRDDTALEQVVREICLRIKCLDVALFGSPYALRRVRLCT